jgi:hypothetical protein
MSTNFFRNRRKNPTQNVGFYCIFLLTNLWKCDIIAKNSKISQSMMHLWYRIQMYQIQFDTLFLKKLLTSTKKCVRIIPSNERKGSNPNHSLNLDIEQKFEKISKNLLTSFRKCVRIISSNERKGSFECSLKLMNKMVNKKFEKNLKKLLTSFRKCVRIIS